MLAFLKHHVAAGVLVWHLLLLAFTVGVIACVYAKRIIQFGAAPYRLGLSMLPHVRARQVAEMDRQTRTALQAQSIGRRIVSAANRYGDIVVLGIRHHDELMNRSIASCRLLGFVLDDEKGEQGFVDNNGVFLTREEAWEIALVAGQILRRVGGDDRGRLFSDNMW